MGTTETGLEFLDRLNPRPKSDGLDAVLFPQGLKSKEVIELGGDVNCGKTLLMTELIVKCVLPKAWNNIMIGGLEAGVVFINTDHHFQIVKLTELLEGYLNNCKLDVVTDQMTEGFDPPTKESVIKYALNNLILLNVFDSFQLKVTAHSLKQLIGENSKINLVLLDSISCNYWADVKNSFFRSNISKLDFYVSTMVNTIQKHIIDYNVCFIYSRPSYFKSATKYKQLISPVPGFNRVTRRLQLKKFKSSGGKRLFCCTITTSHSKTVKLYTISRFGFNWVDRK